MNGMSRMSTWLPFFPVVLASAYTGLKQGHKNMEIYVIAHGLQSASHQPQLSQDRPTIMIYQRLLVHLKIV
jgi:hypothetical protein